MRKTVKFGVILGVMAIIGWRGFGPAMPQDSSAPSDLNVALLAMVGQKCEVYLNSGEMVRGTLWDFGEDFLTLKVKKGLLYSTTEKFNFADIERLQGPDGDVLTSVQLTKGQTPPAEQPQAPQIYFKTGDLVSEDEQTAEPSAPTPAPKQEVEQTRRLLSETEQSRPEPVVQDSQKIAPTPVAEPESRPEAPAPQPAQDSSEPTQEPATTASGASQTAAPAVPTERAARVRVQPEPRPSLAAREPEAIGYEIEKRMRIMRYQQWILFGAAGLTVVVLLFLKLTGMRGAAIGKQSLFPAHLVQRSGQYGIIDQGMADGVRLDDIIRLYRKNGRQVQFKGKVRVVRVAENYSAVAMLKARHNGVLLEVGDVGFRDRNFLLTTFKKIRIFLGSILAGIAKIFAVAARNLEVKNTEASIDLDVVDVAEQKTKEKQETRSSQGENDDEDETINDSEMEKIASRRMGFGLDDL